MRQLSSSQVRRSRRDSGFEKLQSAGSRIRSSLGENLFPAEIEEVFYRHPAVAEVAVVGLPDERRARHLDVPAPALSSPRSPRTS